MAGFLPISIASNGTAPKAAPEAVPSPTGAEGAFGAVLAGLMGNAGLESAPAADLVSPDAAPAFPQAASVEGAGSALTRLKLAFADVGTLPGRSSLNAGLNAGMTSSMALLAALPANTDADASTLPATAETGKAAAEAPRPARKTQADVPDVANADTPEAETIDAPMADPAAVLAAVAPSQPQQARETVSQPAPEFGIDGAADATAIEPAAGNTETAPRAEPAKPGVEPGFEQRDLPTTRHDLSAVAQTRPLTATVTSLSTQPAQSWTNPSAAPVETPDAASVAALAAIAPASGQTASTEREAGSGQRRGAEAAKAEMVADVMAPITGTAPMADAAPGAGMAPAETPAPAVASVLVNASADQPEQILTSAELAAELPAIALTAAPAQAAKPADAGKPVIASDLSMIEPAAGRAQAMTDAAATNGKDGEQMASSDEARAKAETGNTAQTARFTTADQQPAQPAAQTANQSGAQSSTQSGAQSSTLPDGFQPVQSQPLNAQPLNAQPLHAQPLHSQTGTNPSLPHGADVVRVATPQQLPEAVGVAISRHVGAEATEFTLRLDPAELGRIEVKLEMGKDGQASVSIQADNASTFDLLRRDSSALERALADAGLKLDSGGLNFSLRQQDGQNQQFNGEGAQRQASGRMQEAGLAGPEQDNTPHPVRRSNASGLLDLSI